MSVRSEAIKRAVHIEDVIEHYTGEVLKHDRMCCPFHSEKTASFFVNRKKQYFKCFGCGAGGDFFTFIQMYYGCDFKNAIDLLCRDFGITSEQNTADIIRGSERVRKHKAFRKWQNDILKNLRTALWSGKDYLELNRPMIDISEISDDYTLMVNDLCKIEFYFDEFLKSDTEFYKNYRKEAIKVVRRILSRCDKRRDIGADIGQAAV